MAKRKTWGIWSYPVDAPKTGGFIESSKGWPLKKLQLLAKSLNRNGEGLRYEVREIIG